MEAARDVQQLPRGRHRLTRDEVLASQRGRMLQAMADAVAEHGYPQTSVADVLERAGVSRATFYQHFSDKENCFLAAYELSVQTLLDTFELALAGYTGEPLARFDRMLEAYLDTLLDEPGLARVFLIEVYAAGPEGRVRRRMAQERFVDAVAENFDADGDEERFACEALVAAVSSMVTVRVGAGTFDELADLRPRMVEIARRLLPGA